jgi:hypothetical protein
MLYVLRASVRINGNTRQKWFRGDRDGRGSCSARGTHGNQEPPSSRLSYRSAKPREYGGISAKGMAGISFRPCANHMLWGESWRDRTRCSTAQKQPRPRHVRHAESCCSCAAARPDLQGNSFPFFLCYRIIICAK